MNYIKIVFANILILINPTFIYDTNYHSLVLQQPRYFRFKYYKKENY